MGKRGRRSCHERTWVGEVHGRGVSVRSASRPSAHSFVKRRGRTCQAKRLTQCCSADGAGSRAEGAPLHALNCVRSEKEGCSKGCTHQASENLRVLKSPHEIGARACRLRLLCAKPEPPEESFLLTVALERAGVIKTHFGVSSTTIGWFVAVLLPRVWHRRRL